MNEQFCIIWKNRNSPQVAHQTALYLEVQRIFKQSSVISRINPQDRNDFFQTFYINKIFNALKTGLAISTPDYDDMSIGQLLHMMKQYHISLYRHTKNQISSEQDNTDPIETLELAHPEQNSQQQYQQEAMTQTAVSFINACDTWVYELLLKSARGDKLQGKEFSQRAKLGLTLKQSFYTGAVSIQQYHKDTLIGRWLIETYGKEILPIEALFLSQIFKNLFSASLYINEEREKATF